MDRRLICPPASQWELSGGAYLDGDEIVFPEAGARAAIWVHLADAVGALRKRLLLHNPGPGERFLVQLAYRAEDRETHITALPGSPYGAGFFPSFGTWGSYAPPTVWPGPDTHWLRLQVGPASSGDRSAAIGIRYRPGPDDWTITH